MPADTLTERTVPVEEASPTGTVLRPLGVIVLVVAALLTVLWALAYGGGAAPLTLGDPGPAVRWGLPIAKLFVNLSAAGMVGVLMTALFTLKVTERAFGVALGVASISAAVFSISAAAVGFLTFQTIYALPVDAGSEFGAYLGRYLLDTEAGRTWLITAIAGATLTVVIFAVRSWTGTLITALLATATLVPMGTQGHSGEEAFHHEAMTALILHIIGAAVWLGGLLLLILVRPALPPRRLADAVARYSSIAVAAFALVAVSGTVRAVIGLGEWSALLSPYGMILVVKVVALVGLGLFGGWYRTRLINRMRDTTTVRRPFWTLIGFELALMGVASGAAAALARTPPANVNLLPSALSPAELLTGAPLPPELTPDRWLSAWNIDLLWATIAGFGIFFYLAGVRRLHRRGDTWPIHRTILWVAGMLLLVWVTGGVINVYRDYLFSMHMTGLMLLAAVVPLLLVGGAPVTLATLTIRPRDDATRGGREWILAIVQFPLLRVLTNPFVAAGLFFGSLWAFTYTELFRWALYDHLGYEWMVAQVLLAGYLFALALFGADPVPRRPSHPRRLILLATTAAVYALFGITILLQSALLGRV